MKTFIVPTDFSPEAENALEYACSVASGLNARLVLFNSYSFPVHASNARLSAASMKGLEEHNKELLHERAARFSAQCNIDISYEYGLMVEVTEELDKIVEKYQGDMVIMGMAPKSLAQELFGNTTTSVIMKQKYPVLAVPLGSKYTGLQKILFACDDLDQVPKKILDRIREIEKQVINRSINNNTTLTFVIVKEVMTEKSSFRRMTNRNFLSIQLLSLCWKFN